ncbi:hypothetical protein EGR_11032 [Echinococcus granulosus]|uniref:Uncharacterized protein n=1 Tax=Echinococcus granulosus TaxID=6210 RepID=W6U0X8_ECHGR|nr:hypothetical protein EGR_11032 [Echinococcus granulosus]EUB54111.1 hypothetical protein EGR_11032 [Echinococcus granulosus]
MRSGLEEGELCFPSRISTANEGALEMKVINQCIMLKCVDFSDLLERVCGNSLSFQSKKLARLCFFRQFSFVPIGILNHPLFGNGFTRARDLEHTRENDVYGKCEVGSALQQTKASADAGGDMKLARLCFFRQFSFVPIGILNHPLFGDALSIFKCNR